MNTDVDIITDASDAAQKASSFVVPSGGESADPTEDINKWLSSSDLGESEDRVDNSTGVLGSNMIPNPTDAAVTKNSLLTEQIDVVQLKSGPASEPDIFKTKTCEEAQGATAANDTPTEPMHTTEVATNVISSVAEAPIIEEIDTTSPADEADVVMTDVEDAVVDENPTTGHIGSDTDTETVVEEEENRAADVEPEIVVVRDQLANDDGVKAITSAPADTHICITDAKDFSESNNMEVDEPIIKTVDSKPQTSVAQGTLNDSNDMDLDEPMIKTVDSKPHTPIIDNANEGGSSSSKKDDPLTEGDRVDAPGKVRPANRDGDYDDGEKELGVDATLVRASIPPSIITHSTPAHTASGNITHTHIDASTTDVVSSITHPTHAHTAPAGNTHTHDISVGGSSSKSVGKSREVNNLEKGHRSVAEKSNSMDVVSITPSNITHTTHAHTHEISVGGSSKSTGKAREIRILEEHSSKEDKGSSLDIRIDVTTGNGSIVDVLRTVDPRKGCAWQARDTWRLTKARYTYLDEQATTIQINGQQGPTPTAPPAVLVEIAFIALFGYDCQRDVIINLCETLSVDKALVKTLEAKYSNKIDDSPLNEREENNDDAPIVKRRGRPKKNQSIELQKEKVVKIEECAAGTQREKKGGDTPTPTLASRMRKWAKEDGDRQEPTTRAQASKNAAGSSSSGSKYGSSKSRLSDSGGASSGKTRERADVDRIGEDVAVPRKGAALDIRIDTTSGQGSILDLLRLVDPERNGGNKASFAWYKLKGEYSDLVDVTTTMKLCSTDRIDTPAAPPAVLCEIAYLALMKHSVGERHKVLAKLCKALSVDASCIAQWDKKYSSADSSSHNPNSSPNPGVAAAARGKKRAHVAEDVHTEDTHTQADVEEKADSESSAELKIRMKEEAELGSISDTLKFVDPTQFDANAGNGWKRIREMYPHLSEKCMQAKFDSSHTIACASFRTLAEIGWYGLHLREHTAAHRLHVIQKLCNMLGVNVSIIDKLKKIELQPTPPPSAPRVKTQVKLEVKVKNDEGDLGSTRSHSNKRTLDEGSASSVVNTSTSADKCVSDSKRQNSSGGSCSKKSYVEGSFYLRIDKKTNLGSLNDVIPQVLRKGFSQSTEQYLAQYPSLNGRYKFLVCNGRGGATPLADVEVLVEVALVVGGMDVTKEHRLYIARHICDAYNEPRSLISNVQKALAEKTHTHADNNGGASSEKRARTPTSDADPPAKRVMTDANAHPSVDKTHTHAPIIITHSSTNAGGGSSSNSGKVVVQDSAGSIMSPEVKADIDAAKASAALLPILMAQLEEVAKSNMSEHAKKQLEAVILAKFH